jgi:hypothetical protein
MEVGPGLADAGRGDLTGQVLVKSKHEWPMSRLRFVLRPESFCVHRLPPDRKLDLDRFGGAAWYSVTRTNDELSVIAPRDIDPGPGDRQPGWSCLQIADILDFGMVGVIAGISRVLADANVSLFTVSTYNTDHVFVRTDDIETAVRALTADGHVVTKG